MTMPTYGHVTINISLMVSSRCPLGRSHAMSDAIHRAPDRRRYRDGVRAALPLGLADLAFGTWFGVLAHTAGMGDVAAVVMSATTFAGSAQFAAASVLGAGGSVVAAVTAAVMLNLRYGPIGLSAAPALPRPRWRTALTAQLVVDESWAIAQRGPGRIDHHLLIGSGLALYASWVSGTAVGMLAGGLIADPQRLGLDAAAPALFLALLAPQLGSRSRLLAAAGGAALALALQPVAPAGVPIIAASLACLASLVRGRR
jgi:4-azaleucine resistance transporter AzlC